MDIGILDPNGKNNNPFTNEPFSETYKELGKIWSKFPAYENAKDIIKSIDENNVILIVSGTGSGKTVLVPKYVSHVFNYSSNVAITLPKQIIAKSAAEFAAKTLDVKLGSYVGYQYKGESKKSNKTRLLYATDGTIVARLLKDPMLSDFNAVVIDEAHERKVQIDFLLYLLKNTLQKRKDFKLIIMSATINSDIFSSYFKDFKFKQIDVGAKSHYPVESIYLENDISYKNYISYGVDIIKDIIKKDKQDILFFVTSSNEAMDVCKKLQNIDNYEGYCIEVYSGMNAEKQEIAQHIDKYKTLGDYKHKIIIATNVAESSLTIDGIKYVIDSGLELSSYYDPKYRARRLDKVYITQAQVKQRLGRTGRTGPGTCYHLYTKSRYEQMKSYPEPNIRVSNLTNECLRLLNIDFIETIDNLNNVFKNFIEPPDSKYINESINTLKSLNLIDNKKITKLGKLVSELNTEPEIGLCYVLGKHYECLYELIKIFSTISACKSNINSIFITPNDLVKKNPSLENMKRKIEQKYIKAKSKFKSGSSDHLSLLKLYNTYNDKLKKQSKNINDWVYKNFIKKDTIHKAVKNSRTNMRMILNTLKDIETENIIDKLGLHKKLNEPADKRALYCIKIAYKLNTATKIKGETLYKLDNVFKEAKISRSSFIESNNVKNIVYHELFMSMGDSDLNIVSKI